MTESGYEAKKQRACLCAAASRGARGGAGHAHARGAVRCEIDKNVSFSTESLESYFFARWEPLAYDALLVAAAAQFVDRTQKRSAYIWERELHVAIPVHDPDRWNNRRVSDALLDALSFLT